MKALRHALVSAAGRAGAFLARPFQKPRTPEPCRILLIERLRIGDLIVKFPALAALRQRFSHAHLALLTTRLVQDLVEPNPHLDERIYADDYTGWKSLVTRLRQVNADTAILFDQNPSSALLALLSGAPRRLGYDYRGLGGFLTHPTPCPEYANRPGWDYPPDERVYPTMEYWLRILEPLGIRVPLARPNLFLAARDRKSAAELLGERRPGQKLVCIHPGASSSSYEWPLERFAEVATRLGDCADVRIAVTGSAADGPRAAAIAALARGDVLNLAGQTTLGQLAAVIERADLVIAVDTSASHIAAGLGVRTIALYGPGDPRIWGTYAALDPAGAAFVPLQGPSECLICKSPTCLRPRHHCMEAITVEMVLDAAQKILACPSAESQTPIRLRRTK